MQQSKFGLPVPATGSTRNMDKINSKFTKDIRCRHRRNFLKLIYKPGIRNFKYGHCLLPDWWMAETSVKLYNLIR